MQHGQSQVTERSMGSCHRDIEPLSTRLPALLWTKDRYGCSAVSVRKQQKAAGPSTVHSKFPSGPYVMGITVRRNQDRVFLDSLDRSRG